MTTLMIDLSTFRLAPTLGREVLAQLVSFVLIVGAVVLFSANPAVQAVVPGAYAAYALVRIVLVARTDRRAADARRGRQQASEGR